jgi:UPF0271 protein
MTATIDLNCDLGESFGPWTMGDDEGVLAHVSSVSVACGFHAGDPDTMRRTVDLAARAGVALGAHVALPDLQGFGRREMDISAAEGQALALYQIGALAAFAQAAGTHLQHVKPHGALYAMAARDAVIATAIARAAREFDDGLALVGPPGSALEAAAREAGLHFAREAFADRRYEEDGTLTPRRQPVAVIADVDAAVAQALSIVRARRVETRGGATLALHADTICVHGDRPDAARFAERLRAALTAAGVSVAAFGRGRAG